ncbi:SDR family NAD(P)-dependent oxidoreductase [Comamonas sp. NLF-1-9]|uniref:SDR family NAD(P)-dependent oxidoreductase n=1 Tax=Comamonas sp. NLF-1-9 TaxID=2853163 RepID=UPI001C4584A5|nr:SDR family NAD(P)-dependent oxidoreductase [Comamonas sp. NLF-1-9]QXL83425.1 SDR family NAD(P)-dependent oxidoreductase [Comamonas sp. NLF-1-9]
MNYRWKKGPPRTVFISGASSGIGRAMALELAREGVNIALFNRSGAPEVLEELRAAARDPAQRFVSLAADVAQPDSITQAVAQAVAQIGPPDLAINSAGVINALPFDQARAQDFDRVIDINLKGSRHFAAAVLMHMQAGSHLVLVASLAALTGNFAYTAYCASKFGVRGLAEALRYELRLKHMDLSLCCPGEIMTPMVEEEKRQQHPVSAALKAFAGSARLEDSVPALLRGIARREFEIIDSPRARLTAFLSRHTPRLSRAVGDAIARRAGRRMQARP